MTTFDRLSGLPLTVERYELEGLTTQVSRGFERRTTVVHLLGAGHEGIGEDVVYDSDDQQLLQHRCVQASPGSGHSGRHRRQQHIHFLRLPNPQGSDLGQRFYGTTGVLPQAPRCAICS